MTLALPVGTVQNPVVAAVAAAVLVVEQAVQASRTSKNTANRGVQHNLYLQQVRLVSAKAERPNHPSRGGGWSSMLTQT